MGEIGLRPRARQNGRLLQHILQRFFEVVVGGRIWWDTQPANTVPIVESKEVTPFKAAKGGHNADN